MKKIKDNISQDQYKLLMNYLKGDEEIRPHRQNRLLKVFFLLWNFGLRVNETCQFTNEMVRKLLENRELHIYSKKQDIEKTIYLTEQSEKDLKKIFFPLIGEDKDYIITSERGNKKEPLTIPAMINDINNYLKKVFGNDTRITSHSFRQTLITELGIGGVNSKVIQEIIGHKSITTTLNYIKPSKVDKIKAIKNIR